MLGGYCRISRPNVFNDDSPTAVCASKRNREKIRRETRELLQSGVIFKYDGRCVNCVAEAGTLSYVSWSMWTGSLISSSDWTQPDRGHESRHEETAEGCTE